MQIQIENLSKEYKTGKRALDDVNFTIGSGMFGLLGPNGAGKTTLMRILVTLMEPSSGRVLVDGLDLVKNRGEVRSILGYLPQDFTTFSRLSTGEFLDYAARLVGMKNGAKRRDAVDRMLERVGLYEFRDRRANRLSGGMKRRLGIAQALIGSPRIVVVDEPTTGLDPEERIRFRNILTELSSGDISILLSTHIVGDISSTCKRMAMLDHGHLVFNDSPEQLVNNARGHVWSIMAEASQLELIKEKYPVIAAMPMENGWEVQVVADKPEGFTAMPLEPGLEHAYVYFHEHVLPRS